MLKRAGRYELVAELGRGGFGSVYKAFDPTVGRMVAVKTLLVDQDPDMPVRFRNEAAASGRLRHPNIVTIFDFGDQDGVPYIVMELLEGEDLQSVIDKRKAISLLEKIQIMRQVAQGLGHAHSEGIIHRDVKPANIMLLPDGTAKIMDFGIALISHSTQNRLTPRGAMIGTFRYMAPEQFRGSQPDERSDIFAFGLMFYELIAGVHPFHAPEAAALMFNILNQEPVPLREVCPDCPEPVFSTIARLLQKDPDLRYQSFEDVLFDTEPALVVLKRARAEELFEQANAACEEGRLDAAQALVRQILDVDASYAPARQLREQVQTALRRQAIRPRLDALIRKAQEEISAGHFAEAVQKYESAIRLDPSDADVKSGLIEAKAALDLDKQVSKSLAAANEALARGDPAEAQRAASEALRIAPQDARARDLLDRILQTLAEQERKARFTETLDRVRRLIEIKSWKEAAGTIKLLQTESPDASEIPGLLEALRAGFNAEKRERAIASNLASAREEIQSGELGAAVRRLEKLCAEYPDAAEAVQVLEFAKSEIEARLRREFVEQCLTEARTLIAFEKFADAARVLESGLSRYPADAAMQRELRGARASERNAERERALADSLEKASALQTGGTFDEATEVLNAFAAQYGAEASVDELRETIERNRDAARRAAELRALVSGAHRLLEQNRPEEATRMIQGSPSDVRAHPEVTQLLNAAQERIDKQAELDAARNTALAAAQEHRRGGRTEEGVRALDEFTTRYGADAAFDKLRAAILREAQERAEREEAARRHAAELAKQEAERKAAAEAAARAQAELEARNKAAAEAAARAKAEQDAAEEDGSCGGAGLSPRRTRRRRCRRAR